MSAAVLGAVLVATLGAMLTTMRGRPIRSVRGMAGLTGEPERTTWFSGPAYVLLALVALADGVDVAGGRGSTVLLVVLLLGGLTGLVGRRWAYRLVFPVLGVLAALVNGTGLLAGDGPNPGWALAVAGVLAVGVLAGAVWFVQWDPLILLAKVCALVTVTRFIAQPFGTDVLAGRSPVFATGAVVVAACCAAVLLALPGGVVAQLLGLGIALAGLVVGAGPGPGVLLTFGAGWVAAHLVAGRRLDRSGSRRA